MAAEERLETVITKTAVLESRLDGHEDICAKRYGEIATAFDELKTGLGDIKSTFNNMLMAVIGLLVVALGTVIWTKAPWQVEQVRE